jgi:hypothetical protein
LYIDIYISISRSIIIVMKINAPLFSDLPPWMYWTYWRESLQRMPLFSTTLTYTQQFSHSILYRFWQFLLSAANTTGQVSYHLAQRLLQQLQSPTVVNLLEHLLDTQEQQQQQQLQEQLSSSSSTNDSNISTLPSHPPPPPLEDWRQLALGDSMTNTPRNHSLPLPPTSTTKSKNNSNHHHHHHSPKKTTKASSSISIISNDTIITNTRSIVTETNISKPHLTHPRADDNDEKTHLDIHETSLEEIRLDDEVVLTSSNYESIDQITQKENYV